MTACSYHSQSNCDLENHEGFKSCNCNFYCDGKPKKDEKEIIWWQVRVVEKLWVCSLESPSVESIMRASEPKFFIITTNTYLYGNIWKIFWLFLFKWEQATPKVILYSNCFLVQVVKNVIKICSERSECVIYLWKLCKERGLLGAGGLSVKL